MIFAWNKAAISGSVQSVSVETIRNLEGTELGQAITVRFLNVKKCKPPKQSKRRKR